MRDKVGREDARHFVAVHFSPLSTGQLAWREFLSSLQRHGRAGMGSHLGDRRGLRDLGDLGDLGDLKDLRYLRSEVSVV